MKKRINITIDENIYNMAKAICREEGRSLSGLITALLEKFFRFRRQNKKEVRQWQ